MNRLHCVSIELNDSALPPNPPRHGWGRKLWLGLVAWISQPIDFPGKWPVIELPANSYNETRRSDGRVPADSWPADGE
jgi:hypothetical protein